MQVERTNLERYLEVGNVAMFHPDANRRNVTRYKTYFRGWRRDSHIIVDRPRSEQGAHVALQDNQNCVIRFLHEGRACAFDAYVIDWDTRKHNAYVRLSWPQELLYIPFRKFERISLQQPCDVDFPDGYHTAGELRDMSLGGCGVLVDRCAEKETALTLSFALPDGTKLPRVEAIVKSVRPASESSFMLGCQYYPGQSAVEKDVSYFVTTTLMQLRGSNGDDDSRPRVVVIDSDKTSSTVVRVDLERLGINVLVADNSVDGIHRLRSLNPAAVLINYDMRDIDGPTLCNLLRQCPALRQQEIVVYGGENEPQAEAQALQAGASKYFAYPEVIGADVGRRLVRR